MSIPGPRSFLYLGALVWMGMGAAHAEPYLAVGQGYKCGACHTNPTGGGLRSEFGDIFAQNVMPEEHLDLGTDQWLGRIGDRIRSAGICEPTGPSWTSRTVRPRNPFALEQVRTYADVSIIPSRLDFSIDELLAPGAATVMEAYAKYASASGELYVKAGNSTYRSVGACKTTPRFVREVTGISMTTPDTGVELGLELPHWSAQLDLTNGAANATTGNGQQVTAQAVWVHSSWRIGAAASLDPVRCRQPARSRPVCRATHRTLRMARRGRSRCEGEDSPTAIGRCSASLLELDWGLRRGHNLKLTYEYEDPEHSVRNNAETRASVLYEYTPIQFLQLRAGYRRYVGIPQSNTQNQSLGFAEIHVFFLRSLFRLRRAALVVQQRCQRRTGIRRMRPHRSLRSQAGSIRASCAVKCGR